MTDQSEILQQHIYRAFVLEHRAHRKKRYKLRHCNGNDKHHPPEALKFDIFFIN